MPFHSIKTYVDGVQHSIIVPAIVACSPTRTVRLKMSPTSLMVAPSVQFARVSVLISFH